MGSKLLPFGEAQELKARGLTEETCRKFGYTVTDFNGKKVQLATYRDDSGQVIGQKVRFKDKSDGFPTFGQNLSESLFGRHLWRSAGRRVIITEGEIDAMTVSQVLQHKWQVVSIPQGAAGARKALAANLEWLNSFEQVVLCFDMDEPGREAVTECTSLFPPGKLAVVTLPLKDPNEMLLAGRTQELVEALWGAKEHRPDGIATLADLKDRVLAPVKMGFAWCFPWLTKITYGRLFGELVAFGAGSGCGKTTLISQQMTFDLREGYDVAAFLFEQSPDDTFRRVAGQLAKKTFHIPDDSWTQDELVAAVDQVEGLKGQLYLYDHFGSCDWESVRERIRYLAHAKGVRIFYVDHLTALATASDLDEKTALEKIMADMGGLVKELDIWIGFVSHLSTPEGKSHEEGGRVMAKHFKGSRSIIQWSHFMFGLERDTQADDPEERAKTVFRCLKDRRTGRANGFTHNITDETATGLLIDAPDEFNPMTTDESGDCPF